MNRDRAREVANDWYEGQSSALYAFASSGTILDGLVDEITECVEIAIQDCDEDGMDRLVKLWSHVTVGFSEEYGG